MKTEMVLKLLEAGYTKEEINLMEEVEKKPETAPVAEQPAKETKEPVQDTDSAEAPETDTNLQINELIDRVLKLQATVDAMQKTNAEKAETKTEGRKTADSVIKDFFAERKKA